MIVEGRIPVKHNRAEVKYYPGRTIKGAIPAVLEVTDQAVVSLTTQAGELLFSVPVRSVERVGTSTSVLFITVAGKTYKVEFGYMGGAMIGAGAGFRGHKGASNAMKAGIKQLDEAGYYWWQRYFKAAGVPVGMAPLIKYILYGLIVLGIAMTAVFVFIAP